MAGGVFKDRSTAVRYFRFAAEQGVAEAQYRCAIALLTGDARHRNLAATFCYLKLSAEKSFPDGQFTIASMAENGLPPFLSADDFTAVRYYEQCCDCLPMGAACLGWCLQTGRGIPVDFTADSGDPDGVNCFGCCLERGNGVDADIGRAVFHYRRPASLGHPDALFNLGRCVEYGKGIPQHLLRAAKYYLLSPEMKNVAAQNSF
jgi:TPR repeat protein